MSESNETTPIAESAVEVRLSKVQENIGYQKLHAQNAALAIAQYLQVLEGLRGKVPAASLFMVAATLTASIPLSE